MVLAQETANTCTVEHLVNACATAPAGKTPGQVPSKARAGHAGTGDAEALTSLCDGDRICQKAPSSVIDFLQQDAGQLAPFLRVCHDHCAKGRKIYMYALTKPHGSCRGSGGSDMHKQIRNQNRDIKRPAA